MQPPFLYRLRYLNETTKVFFIKYIGILIKNIGISFIFSLKSLVFYFLFVSLYRRNKRCISSIILKPLHIIFYYRTILKNKRFSGWFTFFQKYCFPNKKNRIFVQSKQNSTHRGMIFIYLSTSSAWNPNTWAILCGILTIFLVIVLLIVYFIFRRLHIDLAILRAALQKRPSPPIISPIPDLPPQTETADSVQTPVSTVETKKQYTLLIIEDHLEIRLYLKLIFGNEYNLLMAENGEEGFKKACEEIPDLIITDIMMPVMDGFKCCQLVKENLTTCHIPVILLTALTEEANVMKGIELGADDYIQKPFNPTILRTKVKRLIKSRAELKEIYTRLLTPGPESESSSEEKTEEAGIRFPEDPFIMEIVRIINENMKNPDFNVKKLADIMVISQPTLYRRVKMITNFTISEFIRGVRLKRAAELLRSRRYTVQDIAEMVGYSDLATFRKHFVDFYGTTPSTFSNKMLMEKPE